MQLEVDYHGLNAMLNLLDKEGNIQFDKDKEAVRNYFLTHVNENTVFFHTLEEKLKYLFENNFYEKEIYDQYNAKFVKNLYKRAYSKKFRFETFVGALKYYTGYTLKTENGQRYLERYEDRVCAVALTLAAGKEDLAVSILDEIMSGRYQPATPTFLNAGKKRRGEFVSCFLLRVEDNMESIGRAINSSLQLSKRGGGVALLLSNLREHGSPIKGIHNASSGVIPVMKLLEDAFSYANQLGARQGAGAVYLNAHHPDILKFLDTKRENADEKVRIKTLSVGVVIPDITFELAKTNEPMYLFSPHDVEKVYGVPFGDISVTEKYTDMVNNPKIRKYKISARELFQTIAELQFESGYPYIMFEDSVNRQNPGGGRVNMSNLCMTGDTMVEVAEDANGANAVSIRMDELNFQVQLGNFHGCFIQTYRDGSPIWSPLTQIGQTGIVSDLISVETESGKTIVCTPDHQIFTKNRGWVEAQHLQEDDELVEV